MERMFPNAEKIRTMFSAISDDYDKANTAMSMGVHHLWRRQLVRYSEAKPGDRVLDCATGTGDLALVFKKVVGASGSVIGTDFCTDMMIPALGKAARRRMDIRFEQADVLNLPYDDDRFDISSIAFGIRNVNDPQRGLSELARVVKPGGVVMILEFGQPRAKLFSSAFDWYSHHIMPRIGGWITGHRHAYEYLQDSAKSFPCREEFLALMAGTGRFQHLEYESLTGGIAYMYKGRVK